MAEHGQATVCSSGHSYVYLSIQLGTHAQECVLLHTYALPGIDYLGSIKCASKCISNLVQLYINLLCQVAFVGNDVLYIIYCGGYVIALRLASVSEETMCQIFKVGTSFSGDMCDSRQFTAL